MKAKQIILEMTSREVEQAVVAAGIAALDQCPRDRTTNGVQPIQTVWIRKEAVANGWKYFEVHFHGPADGNNSIAAYNWVGRDDDGLYADKAVYAVTGTVINGGMWEHGYFINASMFSYDAIKNVLGNLQNKDWSLVYSPAELSVIEQIGYAIHAYLPEDR